MPDDYDKPHQAATALLAGLVAGLADDAPERTMVSWPGAADDCEQLTVAFAPRDAVVAAAITAGQRGSVPAIPQPGSKAAVPTWTFGVRFVQECWPIMADDQVPEPAAIDEQAARGMRRFYRCWRIARDLREAGALFAGLIPNEKAAGATVGGLQPVPVSGAGLIGAGFQVTVTALVTPTP